jgi:acetyl-CoA carboxylase, biotin carboxylase subunit
MKRVLIANRGEIAVRIVRACFDEGLESVVASSEVDRDSLAARLADDVVVIGPWAAAESYLSVERVIAAALATGCDAVHPGYGFLSERPELAEACETHGLTFIGPPADVMKRSGDKLRAREVAASLGIPTGGGTASLANLDEAISEATRLDQFPYILKASAGGGGRGMTIVRDSNQLAESFETSRQEALMAFGDGTVYLERYIEHARHVEVQILADQSGNVVHLGDRDCSVQRRHQKLIEEAPAVGLPEGVGTAIRNSAVALAQALGYVGAGTVEFLVDVDRGDFVFLEVNARVQVEHPVTEMVTGIDIVRAQLNIASGEQLPWSQGDIQLTGHSIECRINAEDPSANFMPSPGLVEEWVQPQGLGVRVDTFIQPGTSITPFYDSLAAKLIVHAVNRSEARSLLLRCLRRFRVAGIKTTCPLHLDILATDDFSEGLVTTRWLEESFLPGWVPVDEKKTP